MNWLVCTVLYLTVPVGVATAKHFHILQVGALNFSIQLLHFILMIT